MITNEMLMDTAVLFNEKTPGFPFSLKGCDECKDAAEDFFCGQCLFSKRLKDGDMLPLALSMALTEMLPSQVLMKVAALFSVFMGPVILDNAFLNRVMSYFTLNVLIDTKNGQPIEDFRRAMYRVLDECVAYPGHSEAWERETGKGISALVLRARERIDSYMEISEASRVVAQGLSDIVKIDINSVN